MSRRARRERNERNYALAVELGICPPPKKKRRKRGIVLRQGHERWCGCEACTGFKTKSYRGSSGASVGA